jgi:hypothetical protein
MTIEGDKGGSASSPDSGTSHSDCQVCFAIVLAANK